MIGLDITEKEYRALKYPSYSLLSSMQKVGRDAIYGERQDLSDLDGIIIGTLVDAYLSDGVFPSNIVTITKKPSGNALKAIKGVAARVGELVDKDDVLSPSNNAILLDEMDKNSYRPKSPSSQRLHALRNYRDYANTLVSTEDPLIVSVYQMNIANDLISQIQTRFPWVNVEHEDYYPQVKLTGEVDGVEFKGMLDFIMVDKVNKLIYPYDIKTGSKEHYRFLETSYLQWNYYIQAGLYKELLMQNAPPGYKVMDFRFVYCSRKDFLPIVYRVNEDRNREAWQGFTHNGIVYPGIHELITEYKYYKANPKAMYKYGYETGEVEL